MKVCNICDIEMIEAEEGVIASRKKSLTNGRKAAKGYQCPKCKMIHVLQWKGGRFLDADAPRKYFSNYPDETAKEFLDRLKETKDQKSIEKLLTKKPIQ